MHSDVPSKLTQQVKTFSLNLECQNYMYILIIFFFKYTYIQNFWLGP